jgi:hypothetical protein
MHHQLNDHLALPVIDMHELPAKEMLKRQGTSPPATAPPPPNPATLGVGGRQAAHSRHSVTPSMGVGTCPCCCACSRGGQSGQSGTLSALRKH